MPFDVRRGRAAFTWVLPEDTELTGPMALRLHLEVRDASDVLLFVAVRKLRGGREVGFEGSYGFTRAPVTVGWLRASHRRLDPDRSEPWLPVHPHDREEPLAPGEVVQADVPLLPSATLFRAGEALRLEVAGRWPEARNPLTGPFPAAYEHSTGGTCVLHCGGPHDARLLVPVQPG